jgi:hypothetical protein
MSSKYIYIYQITCNDPNINENYIGQTECFETRKKEHCYNSKHSELKLYKAIRENGGWENWNMRIMGQYHYNNHYDARQIEQKYIDIFNSTLNSTRAYSKSFINEELDRLLEFELRDFTNKILGCFLYDYLDDTDKIMECQFCNKNFSNKSNLKYHIKTNKTCQIIQHQNDIINCEFCGKIFTQQTIIIHNKTCKKRLNEEIKRLQIEKNEDIKRIQIEKDKEIKKILSEKDEEIKKILSEKDEEIKHLQMRILELKTENKIYLQDREMFKNYK